MAHNDIMSIFYNKVQPFAFKMRKYIIDIIKIRGINFPNFARIFVKFIEP